MATKRVGAAELASDVEKATENEGHAESFRRPDKVIHPSSTVMTPEYGHRQQGAPSTDAQDINGNVDSQERDGIPSEENSPKNSKRYIRMAHAALENQQNVHCVLLTLLAGATSVSILQPPGSFDSDGCIRDAALGYLLFASISFALAAAGLIACIVGSATLSDPVFYATSSEDGAMASAREILIIEDNLFRMNRSRIYLLLSLASFSFAFYAGAIAVLRNAINRSAGYAVGTYAIYLVALFIFSFELRKSGNRQSFLAFKRLG